MLRTEPMQKIRVLMLESEREKCIEFLHGQGVIDFRRSRLELGDVQSQTLTDVSNALIRVNGALHLLKKGEVKALRHVGIGELSSRIRDAKFIDEIFAIGESRREMGEDQAALDYSERVAGYFAGTGIDFSRLQSDALAFRAVIVERSAAERIADAVKGSRIRSSVMSRPVGKKSALVFIAHQKDKGIDEIIKGFKAEEIDLRSKYLKGTPEQALALVKKTREAYRQELSEMDRDMAELSARHYSDLANYKEMLEIEAQRAGANANFKRTEKVFVVEGWVPARRYEEFAAALKEFTRGRFSIERIHDGELAPSLVKRPKILRPFDYLMEFYSVPRSDEIDPTWIFIISFPIFYGLMVSDVGYGLASLLFATWITRRTNPEGLMYNSAKIWQLNAVAAMFFGFLSNQYFGFQLNQYFVHFAAFDWVKDATSILLLTIVFGLVQVILGFVFSFINNWNRKGHRKAAVSKLTSIVTILLGIVAVYGFFTGAGYMLPFGIAMLIFLIITGALSGIEASEITNLMTHPLSYARILGFGLASIIIAMLIDNAFTPNFHSGVLGFIILLVVFVLLHFMNMVLGIFEGIIQGVRLNFVEFFSKFYIGGGVKFRPFSYKRVYTKE